MSLPYMNVESYSVCTQVAHSCFLSSFLSDAYEILENYSPLQWLPVSSMRLLELWITTILLLECAGCAVFCKTVGKKTHSIICVIGVALAPEAVLLEL